MTITLNIPLLMQVTPYGYAQMTHMLNALSGGKLLVILEGGSVAHAFDLFILLDSISLQVDLNLFVCSYNLRSISSSATAVIEVILLQPIWVISAHGNAPSFDLPSFLVFRDKERGEGVFI